MRVVLRHRAAFLVGTLLPKPGLLAPTARRRSRGQPAASAQPNTKNQASKTKRPAPHDEFSKRWRLKAAPAARLGEARTTSVQGTEASSLCHGHNATTSHRRGPLAFVARGGREWGQGAAALLHSPSAGTARCRESLAAGLKQTKGSAFSHRSQIDRGTRCQKARPRYGHWKRWESRSFVPAPSWLKACASLNARGFPSPPRV